MVQVSVLVPVYNVKTYLKECLDSLVAQTQDDIEFICIDDGSTDGCSEILDVYATENRKFRVIHKVNSGYGASMNVGLRVAQGEYIGIVESDDFADPDMFRALYDVASRFHADVVKSNCWKRMEGTSAFWDVLHGHKYGKALCPRKEDPHFIIEAPTIWSCIYRRKFLLEQDIWFNETPGASFQDTSFVFLTKAYADRFVLVKEAYLHYRIDNASSSTRSTGKIFSVIDEYDAIQRHLMAYPLKENRELCGLSAELLYWNFTFTENRIPVDKYFEFWRKGYPKLKAAQQQGVFHEDLGKSMEDWMWQRYKPYRNQRVLREGFFSLLRSTLHAYLFGAGRIARTILAFLKKNGCMIDGFVVSDLEENCRKIDGIPVYAMEDAIVNREHDLVLIATTPSKQQIQQEIYFELEQMGYRNVVVLTKELYAALI